MIKNNLLPVGFYDLLFEEAEQNHKNINTVIDIFLANQYRLIKTPLVEFEDSFLPNKSKNSFYTTDVISGKNLVFRNDITLQISRLLNTRLNQETLPLKLCYIGDVLCTKSDELYADRQQTQVGAEIIGCDGEKYSFEIIKILLSALKKLQIKNLLIELSLPGFLKVFLEEEGIKNSDELRSAIMNKNVSLIRKLVGKDADTINKTMLFNNNLSELIEAASSQKVSEELNKAQKISKFLQESFDDVEVRFDLFGDQSSYYNEISFDIFSGSFSYPIARGGRYIINQVNAVGATIYMNQLRRL